MKKHTALYLTTLLAASSAFPGTMGDLFSDLNKTWVGTLSAGPVWANAGTTQTFFLAPEIEKTYAANKSTNTIGNGELFIGTQKSLPYQLQGQLGLAVATTSNANLQGEIWDDADPVFNNYLYQYRVRNTRIVLKGKLLTEKTCRLINKSYTLLPWVSGSLGVGFNRSHYFNNTPVIFEALPNANFTDHTETAFSYTLGAGLQKTLNEHWQFGVGYEFADWGQSKLGQALGQTLNAGPSLNHLYTNGVLFNFTYLA